MRGFLKGIDTTVKRDRDRVQARSTARTRLKWSAQADSVESALVRALRATPGTTVRQCEVERLGRSDR